jgi:hypothetical protein
MSLTRRARALAVATLAVACALLCAAAARAQSPLATPYPRATPLPPPETSFAVRPAGYDDPAAPQPLAAEPQVASEEFLSSEAEVAVQQRWTVWAGAIILMRGQPSGQALVVGPGPETLFNADQFGFFVQGGPDINALYHGDIVDVDFRYFHVNQASAIDSMASAQTDEFLNLHTPFFLDDSPVDFRYVTSLQSVELNLRKNVTQRVTLLAGFRYLSLRDDLGASFFPPGGGPWSTIHMVGINRLYGAQIGADTILYDGGRWQIQCASKAGIYGNGAQSEGSLVTPQFSTASNSVSRMMTAFVGDVSFTGVYALNDHWALRGGYQLLWLSGVALGSEQYATNSFAYSSTASVADGSLFLHGALASVQYSW